MLYEVAPKYTGVCLRVSPSPWVSAVFGIIPEPSVYVECCGLLLDRSPRVQGCKISVRVRVSVQVYISAVEVQAGAVEFGVSVS